MQPQYRRRSALFPDSCPRSIRNFAILLACLLTACVKPISYVEPVAPKPFAKKALKVAIWPGQANEPLIRERVREWASRQGAEVQISIPTETSKLDVDVIFYPPVRLGNFAENYSLSEVPEKQKAVAGSYNWDEIPAFLTSKLIRWQSKAVALPVLGEGQVLAYRSDVLNYWQNESPRPLTALNTWEEYVQLAEFLSSKLGKPCLPALPTVDERLETEFHLIAGSYDRLATQQSNFGRGLLTPEQEDQFFSYHFRLKDASPRITGPAFVEAARLLQRLQNSRLPATEANTIQAWRDSKAVLGIITLAELAAVQSEDSPIRGKIAFTRLPGAAHIFDPATGQKKPIPSGTEANRVPYLGYAGLFGSVLNTSKEQEAAWHLVATLGEPGESQEMIASSHWGAGPWRRFSHLDSSNPTIWFGYHFNAATTRQLVDTLRDQIGTDIVNPIVRLRLPDQAEYSKVFVDALRSAIEKKTPPEAALAEVAKQWQQRKLTPQAYRQSLGL
jgi:ABC-type glycerol-3-phosphate transport system substrate-binding protein